MFRFTLEGTVSRIVSIEKGPMAGGHGVSFDPIESLGGCTRDGQTVTACNITFGKMVDLKGLSLGAHMEVVGYGYSAKVPWTRKEFGATKTTDIRDTELIGQTCVPFKSKK